jgi:crotonobetainyl-CoA:carnitine CoA-transferase CaiB-like acyl-CoA transferase
MLARHAYLPCNHPATGEGRVSATTWRMARRPQGPVRPAPQFGEHSREVLARVAGYSEADLDRFAETMVITDDLIPGVAG